MIGSSNWEAMPRSQRSGRTVSGPKKPKPPQRVAKFEPTTSPPSSAANAAAGSARQRARTYSASPMNASGSGRPRNVPKARRKMRSAAGSTASRSGCTDTPRALLARSCSACIVAFLAVIPNQVSHRSARLPRARTSPGAEYPDRTPCEDDIGRAEPASSQPRTACVRQSSRLMRSVCRQSCTRSSSV